MKMISWLLLLCCTFLIALVLLLTFIQPEFKQEVSMRLLTCSTRKVPIYLYVLAAFTLGLGLGMITAFVGFVKAQMAGMKKNRRIRELEDALAEVRKIHTSVPAGAAPHGQASTEQSPGPAGI
jgi:uncharacterized membrane protein YciS (DUF1049 family)